MFRKEILWGSVRSRSQKIGVAQESRVDILWTHSQLLHERLVIDDGCGIKFRSIRRVRERKKESHEVKHTNKPCPQSCFISQHEQFCSHVSCYAAG